MSQTNKTHTLTQRATVKYKHRILNKIQAYLTRLELSGADENLGQEGRYEVLSGGMKLFHMVITSGEDW